MEATLQDGSLDPALLERRRYTVRGIRFDNDIGEGAVPDARVIARTGAIVLMRPSVFLSLVPAEDIRSVDYLSQIDVPFGSPFIEFRIDEEDETVMPVVLQHEGRSRLTVVMDTVGDEPVPVFLFVKSGTWTCRARELESSWIERIAAGAVREKTRFSVPQIIDGPLFEQAIWMDEAGQMRDLRFGMRPESCLSR